MTADGTTSFFRYPTTFDYLRRVVLPALMQDRARAGAREIVMWSAACSTGQEAYSLAMIALEHAREWRCRIVASDISEASLARAEAGVYERREMTMPAEWRDDYFTREGETWRVNAEVRRRVEFLRVNLAGDWPALPGFDVVFLRNVLIYLNARERAAVWTRLGGVVNAGGRVFVTPPSRLGAGWKFANGEAGRALCAERA